MSPALIDIRGGLPAAAPPPLDFDLPTASQAHAPPPDGLTPGTVRMLLARRADSAISHRALADLPDVLAPGDLVVVNDSATLPAAVDTLDGPRVHLSGTLPDGHALVEVREPAGATSEPSDSGLPGQRLTLPGDGWVRLHRRWRSGRLWVATVALPDTPAAYLRQHGQPIRYGAETPAWPLEAAQTVFADRPGSAEAPSAALAFDEPLVSRLRSAGVHVATLTLHAGVASLEDHEPPYPEWFRVPRATADAVNATRADGRSVIAVGTTVTRALESAWVRGEAIATQGWTDLIIDGPGGVRAIDGLLSGWHEPRASHLDLLEAVAGRDLLASSYERALAAGYRWHTFGDLHLVLP